MQGIGLDIQRKRNEQAFKQQKELMGMQYQNQRNLNAEGAALQYDMWNKTNYGAQMKHIKDAGLNAGLLYGMGGAGGSTTGSQSGGSAASGNAPSQPNVDMNTAMMGMQMKLMQAQANNIDAKTENERGGVAKKLENEVNNLIKTGRLTEEQINKTISEREKNNIENEIKKIDKRFFERNNVAPSEWSIISALKQSGQTIWSIMKEFYEWNSDDENMHYTKGKDGKLYLNLE